MMLKEYLVYLERAHSNKKNNKLIKQRLNKLKPKLVNQIINELHIEAFRVIDCLKCANCCSSISPSVKDNDIIRISKYLRIRPSAVVDNYMLLDDDNDYIMNSSPCPFLLSDNYCSIYESRPTACKGYPHTDFNKVNQLLDLTYKNLEICPAVCYIFEKLRHHKLFKSIS